MRPQATTFQTHNGLVDYEIEAAFWHTTQAQTTASSWTNDGVAARPTMQIRVRHSADMNVNIG